MKSRPADMPGVQFGTTAMNLGNGGDDGQAEAGPGLTGAGNLPEKLKHTFR